jgi:hypothetical protein
VLVISGVTLGGVTLGGPQFVVCSSANSIPSGLDNLRYGQGQRWPLVWLMQESCNKAFLQEVLYHFSHSACHTSCRFHL